MIYARDGITLGSSYVNLNEKDTFIPSDAPIEKLSIWVFRNDANLWIAEEDPPVWQNQTDRELLLKTGFLSLTPITPWTGIRLKCAIPGQTSDFIFVGYA